MYQGGREESLMFSKSKHQIKCYEESEGNPTPRNRLQAVDLNTTLCQNTSVRFTYRVQV